jgi:hypothetical protein
MVADHQGGGHQGGLTTDYSITVVRRMAAMTATGSNATTRQVCSNVPFEGKSGPDMLRSSSSPRDPERTIGDQVCCDAEQGSFFNDVVGYDPLRERSTCGGASSSR